MAKRRPDVTAAEGPPPPRANPELLGHSGAERALIEASASGRLAHAWLLSGPPGIGKATLAFRFARYLLAGGGGATLFGHDVNTLDLAPEDPVFRRVAAGSHSDLMVLEPVITDESTGARRGEITVSQARATAPFFGLTSAEGGWRVVIVDTADQLNRSAANALLKLLEEPPDRSIFILVSNAPGRLLATIRSRCRRLLLRPLDEGGVREFLVRHRPEVAGEDANAIARLAEGSPGRALALADAGGLDLYRQMIGILTSTRQSNIEEIHILADKFGGAASAPAFAALMDLLGRWLARLIRCGATGETPATVVDGEEEAARLLLARRDLEDWTEVWEKVGRLAARTEGAHLDRKQVVITAFTALAGPARP
jgi:DNA polymerase-3 subunit delta'